MSLFPKDDKARKMLPVFKMLTGYFPKAMREITKVCVANNVRYNPDREPADINWARGKSPDQIGSAFRHLFERQVDGTVFEFVPPDIAQVTGFDRVYVLAAAAWRVCAALELEIESQEGINRPEVDHGRIDSIAKESNPQKGLCSSEYPVQEWWKWGLSNTGQGPCAQRACQSESARDGGAKSDCSGEGSC
jgi:hypothetical protein